MDMFFNIIGSAIWFYSVIFFWSKILNKPINYKKARFYLIWIFLSFFSIINSLIINRYISIVIITAVFVITIRFLFKIKLQESIIAPIMSQLTAMILEFVYAIIIVLLRIDVNILVDSSYVKMISNIIIALAMILVAKSRISKVIYKKLLEMTDKIEKNHLIIFFAILMLIANVLAMTPYYGIEFKYLLVFNICMTLTCFLIIFYSFKTQNNYNKVFDKYNMSIRNLRDYEDMINMTKMRNHENKNQLLTLRAMFVANDKNIPEYIDSIIQNKYQDDEKLLLKVGVVPSGGLRAVIYSEILKMNENNINWKLHVDKEIRSSDLIEIGTDNIVDICNIVGVFIDNSIEAVKCIENKEISINLYIDDDMFNIEISNPYENSINLEKINEAGYTTKGANHGYGLALVKNIIDKNPILLNKMAVSNHIFSQILVIKFKK